MRRRPYPAPQEQVEEIERQIQECIDAGLVEEYKHGDYPHHCSPCFLVAKPGSTALRLVVDYGEVNKKTQNHSGSIPNMENTLGRIAKCRYKTKMDKRSGFWQVDLTAAAQELLAFITPKGRVFKWKVMPFGVANAPALFQELMNKILYILRRRPLVQELISRGAEMEAHIDDVSLGTNTKEDHVLLLREFFTVCQENHLRIKLEKCEFMKEEMEYLGFDVGYGWWKPAASKMQPLQDMQIRDDPKKGLHDVRSFVGACNFYRRHIHNFTYSSAPLTDLIKKTTPWRWTSREEECFQELKKKIASSNCLGMPRPEGEIVVITDASDVGGVWFGLGQGLCRTPWPMVSTRLCADTTGLGESRLSGPKACRTVDRPRTPWWHTREGDAAVPVCVARAGQEGGACMLVALAGHDGSYGCAAPGPARWRRCRSSVSGFPRCGLVRPCRRL